MVIPRTARYFNEFYNSRLFQAAALITQWDDKVIGIDVDAKKQQIASKRREAEARHISSVIAYESHEPVGYSVVSHWKKDMEEVKITKFKEEHHIDAKSSLATIVQKFCNVSEWCDKTNSPPIFLVYSNTKGNVSELTPLGLMTYWDLNRRSVYSYMYSILVFVEQTLKEEIYRTHNNGNFTCLEKFIQQRDAAKIHPRKLEGWEKGLKANISKLSFKELCDFHSSDIHIAPDNHPLFTKSFLCCMLTFRNKIAHPVNLILEGGPSRLNYQLQTLREICVMGKEIVTEYDNNPKNSICSTPLNEIQPLD